MKAVESKSSLVSNTSPNRSTVKYKIGLDPFKVRRSTETLGSSALATPLPDKIIPNSIYKKVSNQSPARNSNPSLNNLRNSNSDLNLENNYADQVTSNAYVYHTDHTFDSNRNNQDNRHENCLSIQSQNVSPQV